MPSRTSGNEPENTLLKLISDASVDGSGSGEEEEAPGAGEAAGAAAGGAAGTGALRSARDWVRTGRMRGGSAKKSWARSATSTIGSHAESSSSALRRHFSGAGESSVWRDR